MLINLAANLALVWPLGHVGIAVGTAIAAWANAAVLALVLQRRGHFALDARARRSLPRFVVATMAMVALLWAVQPWLAVAGDALFLRALALALLLGTGVLAYLAAARVLGLFTLKGLAAQLKRKRQ
jgi:putative peptidoglycan lipid II flippase